ncbi:MAG: hypothetical protein CENE_00726 [Candidatus Celerinatantimonas neptuna]|nr:MAG: hypothetical protein CENE_00726 [Candidatus Celerinatantimonas neptuna]
MGIRQGQLSDLRSITDIFNDYIENTHARFETSPFSYQNRAEWFSQFAQNSKYQIFVAHEDHHVLGFACSQPYRMFSAFDETVEVTIYLASKARGNGVGSALYQHLLDALAPQAVHQALHYQMMHRLRCISDLVFVKSVCLPNMLRKMVNTLARSG